MAKKRGPKALSAEEHSRRGTFRSDRHQRPDLPRLPPVTGRSAVGSQKAHGYVSDVDREAVLSQLSGIGWAIASDWMALHVGWDQVSLHLIKHVGLSASRLDALVEDGAILNVIRSGKRSPRTPR